MVDSCQTTMVNVVSGVAQCFGPVIVPPVHLGLFSILENKLIGYSYHFTLIAVVTSPGVGVTVAESLVKVSKWYDLAG